MKQLEFRDELDLDNPEDVNWLAEWAKQAWVKIQEFEQRPPFRERLIIALAGNSTMFLDHEGLPMEPAVAKNAIAKDIIKQADAIISEMEADNEKEQ